MTFWLKGRAAANNMACAQASALITLLVAACFLQGSSNMLAMHVQGSQREAFGLKPAGHCPTDRAKVDDLIAAARRNDVAVIHAYKGNVNEWACPYLGEDYRFNVLHCALFSKHPEAVAALLEKGANPNIPQVKTMFGQILNPYEHADEVRIVEAPLQIALTGNDFRSVALLLKAKADPNAPMHLFQLIGDCKWYTPLFYAAYNGMTASACALLLEGADPETKCGTEGKNAYQVAPAATCAAMKKCVWKRYATALAAINAPRCGEPFRRAIGNKAGLPMDVLSSIMGYLKPNA